MAELDTETVAVFADKKSADRSLRWLRRAGLDPRVDPSRDGYEVRVPAGPQQQRALEVLHAVELSHKRGEVAKPTGWRWLRNRLVNLETLGVVVALATAVVLLIAIGIWIWSLVGMMGWLALIVVFAAALVYFHFSGTSQSPS